MRSEKQSLKWTHLVEVIRSEIEYAFVPYYENLRYKLPILGIFWMLRAVERQLTVDMILDSSKTTTNKRLIFNELRLSFGARFSLR